MHKKTFEIRDDLQNITEINNYFEVDEMIVSSIQVLNRKGYLTRDCCSGHLFKWNNETSDWDKFPPGYKPKTLKEYERKYGLSPAGINVCEVAFKPGIVPPELPPGFTGFTYTALKPDVFFRIRYEYKKVEYTRAGFNAALDEITETMKRLYMWAVRLPNFSVPNSNTLF